MQEIHALVTQKLTQKLVMLMALTSGGQRAQTIHSITAFDIKILDNKVVIPIMSLIKQTIPAVANKVETWLTMFVSMSNMVLYDGQPYENHVTTIISWNITVL